jgi:hypothetical protein
MCERVRYRPTLMKPEVKSPSTKPLLSSRQIAFHKALRNSIIKLLNYAKEISKPPN